MYTGGLRGWKQLSLATAGYVGQERTHAAQRKEPQDPAINLFFAFYAFVCGYSDFCFICVNPRPSAVSPSLFLCFLCLFAAILTHGFFSNHIPRCSRRYLDRSLRNKSSEHGQPGLPYVWYTYDCGFNSALPNRPIDSRILEDPVVTVYTGLDLPIPWTCGRR
jgi:hypothetical protein